MAILISYLIKLSISLAVVYLFYQLFLRRLTFYNWNRWYLLVYSLISFFIPFINIYPVLEKNNWSGSEMMQMIPSVNYTGLILPPQDTSSPWTYQDWSLLLISIGIFLMLVRLLIQQLSFLKIRRNSTLLFNDKIKVYQVDKNIIPFSYGNSIFVNQHQHSEHELREIIRHEFIHVKQKHTIDILWSECLCILNWYNPFAWLIRKSIRQNLEFIADNKVLQNGIDKKEYQYLLLKVIGVSHFSIAPKFNFSSLKKRIAMMNKIKSAKVHLLKFLFILPLMAVMLISFRNTMRNDEVLSETISVADLVLNDGPEQVDAVLYADNGETPYQVKSPNVDTLFMRDMYGRVYVGNLARFEDKDVNGNRFALLLNGREVSSFQNVERSKIVFLNTLMGKRARAKYGDLGKYGVYEMYTTDAPKTMLDTIPGGKKMPENVESVSRYNNEVTVTLKNGEKEHYDFSNADEKKAYEKKYGKWIPPLPPAPPPPPAGGRPGKVPLPPPPPPKPNEKGFIVRVIDDNGDGDIVVIKDKDNKLVKAMDYSEWKANEKQNIATYGEMLPPPPPPIPARPAYPAKPGSAPFKAVPAAPSVPAPGVDDGIIISPSKEPHPASPPKPLNAPSKAVRIRGVASLGNEPLFIIDGVKQERGSSQLNSIDPNDIESIQVLKDQSSKAIYGEDGIHGVILINTKKVKNGELLFRKKSEIDNIKDFKGVLIVDGTEATIEEVNKLDPGEIESINILKNEDTKIYGEKAKNGVILIRTKPKRSSPIVSNVEHTNGPGTLKQRYLVFKSNDITIQSDAPFKGIYLIDGKKYSQSEFNALRFDPNTAKYAALHGKGEVTSNRFGADGKEGVLEILTTDRPKTSYASTGTLSNSKWKTNGLTSMWNASTIVSDAEKVEVLYVGVDNPIKLKIDGIAAKDLQVTIENGNMSLRNGVFYARVYATGNAKMKVYSKKPDGSNELIGTRHFQIRLLPPPVAIGAK